MKILHTKLREDFGLLDRRLIRTELLAETGIRSVSYEPARNCLSIEYDPDLLNDEQLFDIICRHGVYPAPGAPHADG